MPINREIPDYAQDFADIEADIESNGVKLDTVNTNLGTIETDIEATNTALGTVNVNLADIETDIETTNTNLTNIETDVEATNTALGTVNTNLGTIETDIEATNALLTTIDADTSTIASDTTSIDGKTPSLGQALSASSTPVVIASDQSAVSTTLSDALLGVGDLIQDAWGVQKVSFPVSLFSSKFTFDVTSAHWFLFHGGTQVYTSSNIVSTNGAGTITADATVTSARLESRECPRYQANRGHLFSTALWCPNKTNDGQREWGLGIDGENGCFFRLKSTGLLYAVVVSGGTEDENLIDTSGVSGFDVQKGNIYDIQFQWRGLGNYKFFINNVLVYTFSYLGTLTTLSMENPALPVHFHSERTTQDVSIYVGCVDITSENGNRNDREVYTSAYAEAVSVNGTDAPVIAISNPLLIGSDTNTRTITLARISVTCSKKAVFKVWMTRDPADLTGETFQTLGNGSYVQTDSTDMSGSAVRATAATTANMQFITSIPVEATSTREVDNPYRDRIEFPIVRGDYLVITCTASTASADAVIEWGEQR